MKTISFPDPADAIPSEAEQIQRLSHGHILYMLPKSPDRPFPIHVFVGTDMHRPTVDLWHDCMAEVIMTCTDPAVFLLHDFRNPAVNATPYALAKGGDLRKLRPELAGASALVISNQGMFMSILQVSTRTMPSSRPVNTFLRYDQAVRWLCSYMVR